MVTPIRDGTSNALFETNCDNALLVGMNLVCKEYVSSHNDERGCLVLSEFAGAAITTQQQHNILFC
jgi:trehalose-6-phosphate synthase